MSTSLRNDADNIIIKTLESVKVQGDANGLYLPIRRKDVEAGHAAFSLPQALQVASGKRMRAEGGIYIVAVGKAGWQMCDAAIHALHSAGRSFEKGVVITKYGHALHALDGIACYEAGHPVPDDNSYSSTEAVIRLVSNLRAEDTVWFLISGGGSALFEKPLLPPCELQDITKQLLASGADITEINAIRKRLSAVKGGRFAQICAPARIKTVILSDVIGDPPDMIASGPAFPDRSTCQDALAVVSKYGLKLSEEALCCLHTETPKDLPNACLEVIGNVSDLCHAAADACSSLGYEPRILTDHLNCEAREAGRRLAECAVALAGEERNPNRKYALILGGETVVHLKGTGLGGRNQELALSAGLTLHRLYHENAVFDFNACDPGTFDFELFDHGMTPSGESMTHTVNSFKVNRFEHMEIAVFSLGSDGTDGPTDAAGGYVDGDTVAKLEATGMNAAVSLADNDSYHALAAVGGLLMTGATGTNVNDVAIALIRPKHGREN